MKTEFSPASSDSTLFIVTAPSGAGKSSLLQALTQQDPCLGLSISHTTRTPRPGEKNGREYHFTSVSDFRKMEKKGEFLEWAKVYDNYYGTSRDAVLERLASGWDTLLEIDWQGAAQIRKLIPLAISIFILPPSIDALKERLNKRGQDSQEEITKRLQTADEEISHASGFVYVIINSDFDLALSQLAAVVQAARCRLPRQIVAHAGLFGQFGIVPGVR